MTLPPTNRVLTLLPAQRAATHMAQKVRALSHRVPLYLHVGNRGFAYSVSGWHGAL